jgi:AraC family transcriptional regulator
MPKVRTARPAQSPNSGRLELHGLYGGFGTFLAGETLGPRTLADYELVWIINGHVVYHADDQNYDAPPGALILARPGVRESYTWDRRSTTRHAFFHFSFTRVPHDWPPPREWPVCRCMPPGDALRPLFRHVVERHCVPARRTRMEPTVAVVRVVETLLSLFIEGEREERNTSGSTYSEPVARSLRWAQRTLLSRPSAEISLLDMARAGGVSAKHLCRLFAAASGISPMHAVRLIRLEHAAALLARSNLSIKQVAERMGFANQFHFSRAFREAYGASPSEARAAVLSGALPLLPRVGLELPEVETGAGASH